MAESYLKDMTKEEIMEKSIYLMQSLFALFQSGLFQFSCCVFSSQLCHDCKWENLEHIWAHPNISNITSLHVLYVVRQAQKDPTGPKYRLLFSYPFIFYF